MELGSSVPLSLRGRVSQPVSFRAACELAHAFEYVQSTERSDFRPSPFEVTTNRRGFQPIRCGTKYFHRSRDHGL